MDNAARSAALPGGGGGVVEGSIDRQAARHPTREISSGLRSPGRISISMSSSDIVADPAGSRATSLVACGRWETTVPEPCEDSIQPSPSSSCSAATTVLLDTPNAEATARLDGTGDPGPSTPDSSALRNC